MISLSRKENIITKSQQVIVNVDPGPGQIKNSNKIAKNQWFTSSGIVCVI